MHVAKKSQAKKWEQLNPFVQAQKSNKKSTEKEIEDFKKLLDE